MLQVFVLPIAVSDSYEIWSYIAKNNKRAADRWIDELNEQYNLLAQQPLIGRQQNHLGIGVRSIPFGRYLIFYKTDHTCIEIVRILHSARDISNHFT